MSPLVFLGNHWIRKSLSSLRIIVDFSAAILITTVVKGDDEETTIARRNLMRYLCLTQVLVLRDISVPVRKRFPNLDSVVEAGEYKGRGF